MHYEDSLINFKIARESLVRVFMKKLVWNLFAYK